jgi:hypothetical protein
LSTAEKKLQDVMIIPCQIFQSQNRKYRKISNPPGTFTSYVLPSKSITHCSKPSIRGFRVNLHYTPVHLQPYYRNLGFQEGDYPEAESYGYEAISLPIYPDLTNGEQNYVIETLKKHI